MGVARVFNRKLSIFVLAIFALVAQPFYGVVQNQVASAATANITQLSFTTSAQTLEQNEVSATMTVQPQSVSSSQEEYDTSSNNILITSSSATGEFSTNGSSGWAATNSTNRGSGANTNFYYRDSSSGVHTITAKLTTSEATPRILTTTQEVTINAPTPPPAPPAAEPTSPPVKPAVAGQVIYDSIPETLPSNFPSVGFQATQTNELGDKINFAPGTSRTLSNTAVTLSSWACESGSWNSGCVTTPGATFSHPITLNIYNVAGDGTVGSLIESRTQSFAIPYRPSSDPTCLSATAWRDTDGNCFNGLSHVIVFDTSGITVPDSIIYTVGYNTNTYGASPLGVAGSYDSLNVALSASAPQVGADSNSSEIFRNRLTGLQVYSGYASNGNPAALFTAIEYMHNPTDSSYIAAQKNVRANTVGDLASQVRAPSEAEGVRFNFTNADNSINNVVGYQHVQAGQWPNVNGDKQYRVGVSAPNGQYTVSAEYLVNGTWHPVTGSATLFSIDKPTGSYISPNATKSVFRNSDNPVRVKAEDQFNQFKHVVITINGTDYTVLRANCDLRQAGNYVLCDVSRASNWAGLTPGAYTASAVVHTQVNNRSDAFMSQAFTIDTAKPTVTNFQTPLTTVDAETFQVSAQAADDTEVESVNFYVTAPRADGACTGSGTIYSQQRVTTPTDGTYVATLSRAGLDGNYCVYAVARDTAFSNSDIEKRSIIFEVPAEPVDPTEPTDPGEEEGEGGSGNGSGNNPTPLQPASTLTATNPVTTPLTASTAFNPIFNTDFAGTASSTAGDVLGTTTEKNAKKTAQTNILGVDDEKGTILGMAWYWWLLILAAVAGLIYYLVARNRSQQD